MALSQCPSRHSAVSFVVRHNSPSAQRSVDVLCAGTRRQSPSRHAKWRAGDRLKQSPCVGFGVCTVQTHWSRPGAILTAYSMCRCSISSPEGCSWEPVALCKYRPSAPLWRRSVHNCSSIPDRAIVLGARHATYDTCQPIGWTRGRSASGSVVTCCSMRRRGFLW